MAWVVGDGIPSAKTGTAARERQSVNESSFDCDNQPFTFVHAAVEKEKLK
jgi:hypothetical protein